jgi:hypothetical protein
MTNDLTADQHNAMKHIPECVELEDLDKVSTWQHVIYRVEHGGGYLCHRVFVAVISPTHTRRH